MDDTRVDYERFIHVNCSPVQKTLKKQTSPLQNVDNSESWSFIYRETNGRDTKQ